jgi:uncharacterized protein YjbJ (UPF0337 family)
MNDRIDELKGDAKEGVGKVTGNERLEAEGKAESASAKASREVKGAGNQAKGKIEETVGKATGNDEMQAHGVADQLKGDGQRAG